MQVQEVHKVLSIDKQARRVLKPTVEGKEAAKEMLSSSPSSSMTIRLIIRPRLTRCQKARGHCKVTSNRLGYIFSVHVFQPSKFSKPTVLRNSHPHNSVLFCWVAAKGPEARAAFSPPEISRQLRRAVSHQHSP